MRSISLIRTEQINQSSLKTKQTLHLYINLLADGRSLLHIVFPSLYNLLRLGNGHHGEGALKPRLGPQ